MPGVLAASESRLTSSSSGSERVCTSRICRRPSLSGGGTATRRSKRPGAQQRGVEDLRPVGRGEHDHRLAGLEAVHLGEDLVERLLALVVAAAERGRAAGARAPDRVHLVDEDDRGLGLLGLLEEVADARGADADDRLDELRRGDREERHAGLPRHRAREQRLAGARAPGQEHAARDAPAEAAIAVRVLEEVDDLGELGLGLVDPRHVGERDLRRAGLHAPGAGAPERAERVHLPAARAAREVHEQADEQDHRAEAEDDVHQHAAAGVDRLRGDDHALVLQELRQLLRVGEGRDLGVEVASPARPPCRPAG